MDSRLASDRRTRTRTYECEACWARFRTREAIESQELGQVIVRRSTPGTRHEAWEPFRTDAIAEQLRATLTKVLIQGERDAVVDRVVRRLEQRLSTISASVPAVVARRRKWERNRVYIEGTTIRAEVEAVLKWSGQELDDPHDRDRHRAAHALYALATTGTQWDAGAAVSWLHENYALPRPGTPTHSATNTVAWHPPSFDLPTRPLTVVKNFRPALRRAEGLEASEPGLEAAQPSGELGERERLSLARSSDAADAQPLMLRRSTQDFDEEKLRRKVGIVLRGRRHQDQITEGITQWVLWSLVGQTVVRSSQLSALVVECLRRSDPIGYLRWVTVGKELNVHQLHEEATNLLTYPGTRLHFRQDSAPTALPTILPGWDQGTEDAATH